MNRTKKLVVVLGPTAVGKTAFAIELAKAFNTEIISSDSRQFFHELNIGVARPSVAELAAVKHHFIDFISIQESFSAGAYERAALAKLEELFIQNDVVVCCGGSMLYIDALVDGLDELPSDTAVRNDLKVILKEKGIESLQEELKLRDPVYFNQVDTNNPHRLIRALEVCRITSGHYSSLRKSSSIERNFDIVKIGLTVERDWLYIRINQRVEHMMQCGLLDEVKMLIPFQDLNALNTVGYKELFDYFEGKHSLDKSVDLIKQHTRNFAKRQLTWWKRDQDIQWFSPDDKSALTSVISLVSN
jgi:tRNA dimethylallyltransferase